MVTDLYPNAWKKWTVEEELYLIENWNKGDDQVRRLSRNLKRTPNAVVARYQKMVWVSNLSSRWGEMFVYVQRMKDVKYPEAKAN